MSDILSALRRHIDKSISKPNLYFSPLSLTKQSISESLGTHMNFQVSSKVQRFRAVSVQLICLLALVTYMGNTRAEARAVLLTKNFEPGSAAAFAKVLTPDIDTVILDVGGGYLTEGIEIGRIIRAKRLRTVVPEGGSCLSACAEAFLGGVNHRIDGTLAFHVPRMERLRNSKQAFDVGLAGGTLSAMYRFEMGFGFDLTLAINKWTSANRLLVFNSTTELFAYKSGRSIPSLPVLIDYRN